MRALWPVLLSLLLAAPVAAQSRLDVLPPPRAATPHRLGLEPPPAGRGLVVGVLRSDRSDRRCAGDVTLQGPRDTTAVVLVSRWDSGGTFHSTPLAPGRYHVRARCVGHHFVERWLELRAGTVLRLRIVLQALGLIIEDVEVQPRAGQSRLPAGKRTGRSGRL